MLLDQGVVRDNSGDTRRPRARSRARSRHRAAGPAIARSDPRTAGAASRAARRRRHRAPCHAPVRSAPRRRGRSQRRADRARSPSARPPARSGAGAGRTRSRRPARRYSLAGRPAPGPVRPVRRRYSVCSRPASTSRSRWNAASSRLIPSAAAASSRPTGSRRATTKSYKPRRVGSASTAATWIGSSVGESVGHAASVPARRIMKRLDSGVVGGVTLARVHIRTADGRPTTRGGSWRLPENPYDSHSASSGRITSIWTREYIVAAVAGTPDADAAAGRLLKNQEDIGAADRRLLRRGRR